MTSTYQGRAGRRGRTIAATLLASAASVVGLVGTAAPASAADQYIALALGYVNENPPVQWPAARRSVATKTRPHRGR